MLGTLVSKAKGAVVGFFRREPLVVVNTSATFLYGLATEVSGELTAEDGWRAAAFAAVTVLARRYVAPALTGTDPG